MESGNDIPDTEAALSEAYRVLAAGGTMIFDDLIKPKPDISQDARNYVYDWLLFDTDFSFTSYQDALRDAGFQVTEARDLSQHLKTSYECLAEITNNHQSDEAERFQALSFAYTRMAAAVEKDELGWGLYVCSK